MNNLARILLKPAALVYEQAVQLRNYAYEHKLIKAYKASVPVISIGNITLGGTGKTPVTINIAKKFIAQGKKVAILSRGYRRKSAGTVVVSDGTKLLCSVEQAGDEPYLIAQCVPEAVVIVAAKRACAARVAVDSYKCDVILLDDGFQHRALHRDCDIVLIDASRELLKDCMFPSGSLREPLTQLKRAHAIVFTNAGVTIRPLQSMISQLAPNAVQCRARFVPSQLVSVFAAPQTAGGTPAVDRIDLRLGSDSNNLRSKSVVAFCGIAGPHRFFEALNDLGLHTAVRQSYPDHHWYCDADVQEIKRRLENSGANLIVTTAKDAVRLQAISGVSREILAGLPLWYLDIDVEFSSDISSIIARYTISRQ